jgi:acyl carrier protein
LDLCAVSIAIQQQIKHHFALSLFDIVFVKPKSLCKTTSGKIQRYRNKKVYQNKGFDIHLSWQQLNEQTNANLQDHMIEHDSAEFQQLSFKQQLSYLRHCIVHYVAKALELPPQAVDTSHCFGRLGFDSLKAVELLALLQANYQITHLDVESLHDQSIDSLIIQCMNQLLVDKKDKLRFAKR